MKCSIRSRSVVLAVAAGALLAVPFASPASAASSLSCSKLSSTTSLNLTAKTGTTSSSFLSCGTGALAAGGSSKVTVPISKITGSLTEKITWKGGKGTTSVTEKYTSQKTLGKCPKGTKYRTIVSGTTKTSTGAAAKVIKSGETISAQICTTAPTTTKYVSILLKGTTFKI
jgi:hypothetical protein